MGTVSLLRLGPVVVFVDVDKRVVLCEPVVEVAKEAIPKEKIQS